MKKLLVRIICIFIPFPNLRRKVRRAFEKQPQPDYVYNELYELQKQMRMIRNAIADPTGYGKLALMYENAHVPKEYRWMFDDMPAGALFIDCGVNVGLISDIALFHDAKVVGFEPNPTAFKLLAKKYAGNRDIELHNAAISYENGDAVYEKQASYDQGGNIVKMDVKGMGIMENDGTFEKRSIPVKIVRLSDVILAQKQEVYICKIDIEGAEFDVVKDLIHSGAYKNCKYILVETHERFFDNGDEIMAELYELMKTHNVSNIDLKWV